jgi:hypothetical protein
MKAIKSLVVAVAAAVGVAAGIDAQAAGPVHSGVRSGGTWHGGGAHWSGGGGHWRGGWGGRYWAPRIGFYVGAPLLWSSWYWGWPYDYYGYGYPRTVVVDRVIEREGVMEPSADARPGPGAPAQAPLYMNYCESAKAYYPKVTTCSEGWKFIAPSR